MFKFFRGFYDLASRDPPRPLHLQRNYPTARPPRKEVAVGKPANIKKGMKYYTLRSSCRRNSQPRNAPAVLPKNAGTQASIAMVIANIGSMPKGLPLA